MYDPTGDISHSNHRVPLLGPHGLGLWPYHNTKCTEFTVKSSHSLPVSTLSKNCPKFLQRLKANFSLWYFLNKKFNVCTSNIPWYRLYICIPRRRMEHSRENPGPKQNLNISRQTPNSVAPCLSQRLWWVFYLSIAAYNTLFSLDLVSASFVQLFGRNLTVLASPTSSVLHCYPSFIFIASQNVFSGTSHREPLSHRVLSQWIIAILGEESMNLSILHSPKLFPQGWCCQVWLPGWEGHFPAWNTFAGIFIFWTSCLLGASNPLVFIH